MIKVPEEELLQLLLLHNKEDVLGMYNLLEMLSYTYFLQGHFQLSDIEIQSVSGDLFFNITLIPDILLPQTIHCMQEHATLVMHPEQVLLSFPVFHGALRHYFPDYKNYYYLPGRTCNHPPKALAPILIPIIDRKQQKKTAIWKRIAII